MSKYNNTITTIFGETFDSKKEAERWLVLRDKEKRGEVRNLRRQVEFTLCPTRYKDAAKKEGVILKGCSYKADFTYEVDGHLVVEDVKGMRTKEYVVKKKWLYDKYGLLITEV